MEQAVAITSFKIIIIYGKSDHSFYFKEGVVTHKNLGISTIHGKCCHW